MKFFAFFLFIFFFVAVAIIVVAKCSSQLTGIKIFFSAAQLRCRAHSCVLQLGRVKTSTGVDPVLGVSDEPEL